VPGLATLGDDAMTTEGKARSRHTPGPWKADVAGPFVLGGDTIAVEAVTEDGAMVRREICTLMIDTEIDEDTPEAEEDKANARLIALAPRMYEALKLTWGRALCTFPQHPDDRPCDGCRGWRMALEIFRELGEER
jgi:hypothetical protein